MLGLRSAAPVLDPTSALIGLFADVNVREGMK